MFEVACFSALIGIVVGVGVMLFLDPKQLAKVEDACRMLRHERDQAEKALDDECEYVLRLLEDPAYYAAEARLAAGVVAGNISLVA